MESCLNLEVISTYRLELVETTNAHLYEELTYPHFRPFFRNLTSNADFIAIGAASAGVPLGLILARCHHWGKLEQIAAKILSVFVVPTYRNQGLGNALLAQMENELRQRDCQAVEIRYLTSPNSPALERILTKQHWSIPEATSLVCYASTDRVQQTEKPHLIQYLDRLLSKLPADYTIFPWETLTTQERQTIEQQMETDALMRRFNPFIEESQLEPLNSLGLRYQDQVVGWIITHRLTSDTIRYTQMYVNPQSQPLSRSTLLLAKAIQLQVEHLPKTQGTFRVDMDNTPMVKFVHRRLKPYLDEIRTAWCVRKSL
jgi:GNAT superfamily N-acetyltransferase